MSNHYPKNTRDEIITYISYCPETGIFRWLKAINKTIKLGSIAGVRHSGGYIQIGIKNHIYLAHRLAWFITYGEWPNYIDHINGIKDDNRLCNLRNVSNRQNCQNQIKHRLGKLVGAIYDKNEKCWRSAIKVNRKSIHLGYYDTEIEAHNAYVRYIKEKGLDDLVNDHQDQIG